MLGFVFTLFLFGRASFRSIKPGGAMYFVHRGIAVLRRKVIHSRSDLIYSMDGRKFFRGDDLWGRGKSNPARNSRNVVPRAQTLHSISSMHKIKKERKSKQRIRWSLPSKSSSGRSDKSDPLSGANELKKHDWGEHRVLGRNSWWGLDNIVIDSGDNRFRKLFRVETLTFFETFALSKEVVMEAASEDVILADTLLWYQYRVKFCSWARSVLWCPRAEVEKVRREYFERDASAS